MYMITACNTFKENWTTASWIFLTISFQNIHAYNYILIFDYNDSIGHVVVKKDILMAPYNIPLESTAYPEPLQDVSYHIIVGLTDRWGDSWMNIMKT